MEVSSVAGFIFLDRAGCHMIVFTIAIVFTITAPGYYNRL
jgi:hypothetical protein